MKFGFYRSLLVFGAVFGLSQAFAAPDATHIEYFDCWMEKGSALVPAEKARLKATDDSGICGCFKVRENGGLAGAVTMIPNRFSRSTTFPSRTS